MENETIEIDNNFYCKECKTIKDYSDDVCNKCHPEYEGGPSK